MPNSRPRANAQAVTANIGSGPDAFEAPCDALDKALDEVALQSLPARALVRKMLLAVGDAGPIDEVWLSSALKRIADHPALADRA